MHIEALKYSCNKLLSVSKYIDNLLSIKTHIPIPPKNGMGSTF